MADLFFSEYIEGTGFNKALEIFNGTGAAIDLAAEGYVLQIFFNGSTTAGATFNLTGTVANNDVFVFAQANSTATPVDPAITAQADQTTSTSLFNGDDAIVLRKGGSTGAIVDVIGQVGFDPGTEWGTGVTSTADNTLRRKPGTVGDTNPSDAFDPSVQYEGFATNTFDGLGSYAGGGGDPTLTISVSPNSISEAGGAATGTVTRTGNTSSALTVTLTSSDTTEATVPETVVIAAGETSATFAIAAVDDSDIDGNQAVSLTASATGFTDTTAALTVTDDDIQAIRIRDIQGAQQVSPLVGQQVQNVQGIVTAVRSNGFYFQDPNPDNNDATSEGIFVFTSSAPTVAVGDAVAVNGTVSEFRPGGASTANLTITQIGGATVTRLSSGNPLPVATILGNGGRAIPTTVIDNDAVGGTPENPATPFDPAQDGIDFYESVEGMLVQVNNAVAVSPTSNFGEIAVLADNGENAGLRTPREGIIIRPDDFNPERIIIDDLIIPNEPQVNVGDQFNGAIVGVVDYSFGNFKLLNTQPLPSVTGSLQRETTALQGSADQLTVATFNVENLDTSDGSVKFAALADAIVNNLKTPDIISLEEVQDNNGATNDNVVDASVTYQTLIDAIAAAGGPRYEFRQVNPVDDQDGGEPGGNIRVGFLFNPDRVDFVDRPGGSSTADTDVLNVSGEPQLSASPGRIDPTNPAFNSSRKPLVGEFVFNGQTVFVIGNHFNSKGGDDPLFGRDQPPTLSSEVQRLQQAAIVNQFVDEILAIDPNAKVVAMGDFNDFQFSNPLRVLQFGSDSDRELYNLYDQLPANEQYSYVFDGNSQALDHILVSDSLNGVAEFDVVHINAEFADQISDHDPLVARFTLAQPNRSPIAADDSATTTENAPVAVDVLANDSDPDSDPLAVATFTQAANGTVTLENGVLTYTPNASFFGSDSFTYTVTDSEGAVSNPAAVSITVNAIVNEIRGTSGNDRLTGTNRADVILGLEGNDRIRALAGNDQLDGGSGNDELDGGAGDDELIGGTGNDIYIVDSLGDTITEASGAGTDRVRSSITFTLDANLENLDLTGSAAIDGTGNAAANTLTGNSAGNVLAGGDGRDRINGGAGADTLLGEAGDDTLNGGDGDDLLRGGLGSDSLEGGRGSDTFVLAIGEGRDAIRDFMDGQDLIGLAAGLTFEQLAIAQGTGSNSTSTLISFNDGGSLQLLATLRGVQATTVTEADFVLA